MKLRDAIVCGAAGAVTTNALHELVRRAVPNAPRVDLLGMQALSKTVTAAGAPAPRGRRLYLLTLAGDLVSNAAYFALVGVAGRSGRRSFATGAGLGVVAGLGAVLLPRPLGLAPSTTARSFATALLTVALYTAGGLAAAAAATVGARSPEEP